MIDVVAFTNPVAPPPANPLEAVFFYVLLTPIGVALQYFDHVFRGFGPTNAIGAFGLAVIVLTLCIRGVLFPLFRWQIRTQWKIQADQRRMGPDLREIQAKYKKDKARLQAETMELYKRHQINPLSQLSGCLPLLIQLPFIYALFGSIKKLSSTLHGHLNFLWIPNLQMTPLHAGILGHPTLLAVPLLAGALTFMQSKMMMQPPRPDMTDQERQMQRVMSQTTYLMPVLIAVFALNFQQGIGLYWVAQSAVMVIQIFSMMGWGGLRVPNWFPGAGWKPSNSPVRVGAEHAGTSSGQDQPASPSASPTTVGDRPGARIPPARDAARRSRNARRRTRQ